MTGNRLYVGTAVGGPRAGEVFTWDSTEFVVAVREGYSWWAPTTAAYAPPRTVRYRYRVVTRQPSEMEARAANIPGLVGIQVGEWHVDHGR